MTQPYYETMYILRPDIPEEEVETHVAKYRDLVIEAGAEVLDTQMRGKRRLAYSIAKHREGIYVQLNHSGNGQQVAVLERAMRLSEDVIRYLTVIQDGPMPPPRRPRRCRGRGSHRTGGGLNPACSSLSTGPKVRPMGGRR